MTPFTIHTGIAAPLMHANIDTDVVVRIERLISEPRDKLGPFCFESWRYLPDGSPDPGFLLNRPPYDRSSILIAGVNFGCGSSREAAVWALQGFGFACVIAPSFGEIFYGNCIQNGVLPVALPAATVAALADEAAATPGRRFSVDLVNRTVTPPSGVPVAFDIAESAREMLLEGLDEIAMTMKHVDAMETFQARDRIARPWIYEIETMRQTG